jgi:simple sugar transport system substrate-binding protein/ribose transport system substrate-binding protein
MKLRHLILAAAVSLIPLSAHADQKLADFKLAERIKTKIAAGEKLDFYVSYQDTSNEFAPFLKAGVERGASENKVNAAFIGPVGSDADAQINELENLMSKMDGLAVSSVSTDALAPVIDRILEAGIPVVTYNTDNPDSKRLAFAGQDLVQSGVEAGKLMAQVLGGKGKVMIITLDAAAQWSLDREKGAREGLAAAGPDIEIVNTLNTGSDPQKMYSAIENAMLADPSVTGLLSLECCTTPAAGTWVQRNGKMDKVKVVGFDLLDQTVDLVKSGEIQATIDQAPEKQGFAAVDMLVKFLAGTPIDNLDTGVGIYTKDNIAEVAN